MEDDPRIDQVLLAFSVIQVAILLPTGFVMFFMTKFAQSIWPWELPSFNARFIGGFYLGAAVGAAVTGALGRWSLWRVVQAMTFTFTSIVFVVSFFHLDAFDFGRWGSWAWFALYFLIPAFTGWALVTRRQTPTGGRRPRPWLRALLFWHAVVVGAYGVAMLVAPVTMAAFWPWPVDRLHGHLYAAVFVAEAVGPILMSRRATPRELLGVGLTWLVVAALIMLSVPVTNAQKHSVDYGDAGTLLWFLGFGVLALIGVLMALSSRRQPEVTPSSA